jgi:flagellar hook-length control protein FliK
VDDSSEAQAADVLAGGDLPAAALSLLQGMLAPVVPNAPRDTAEESGVASSALSGVEAELAVTLTTESANSNAIKAAATADPAAAPRPDIAVLVAPVRTKSVDLQPDAAVPVPTDDSATALTTDIASTKDASAQSSMGERLVGALAERFSMRTDGDSAHAEADRSVVSGPNPYAGTREIVATSAGAVSDRPEVVHSTVGSPRWANDVGSKLAMMSVRGQQEGSLSLTPEHLGPLEVRISVNQDTTNVWFGAQHADTRAALAEALPRLREMFAASGLALGHAGVSHEMPGQDARRGEASASRLAAESEPSEIVPARTARVVSGLLDTWA